MFAEGVATVVAGAWVLFGVTTDRRPSANARCEGLETPWLTASIEVATPSEYGRQYEWALAHILVLMQRQLWGRCCNFGPDADPHGTWVCVANGQDHWRRFRIVDGSERIGGFSIVHKAYDLETDPLEAVAVKILRPGAYDDLTNNISVSREFESLARLSHGNVVRLIDAGVDEESGQRYLALEWVVSSMDAYLDSGEPEPDDFMGSIGIFVARAMAYARDNDVAHRDLKPSNVLIESAVFCIRSGLVLGPCF